MSYFSLRKHAPAEEPEPAEEQPEEPDDEPEGQPPPARGPVITGLLGPGAWIAARFGTGTAWTVHAVALWAFSFYGGGVAVGIALVWLLAMLLFIPREHLDRLTATIERRASPSALPPAAPVPGGEREAVRRLLLDLLGDAPGVHLKTVLAHLQAHGQWEGKTVADLRVHLQALGIPVRPKVKVGGTPTRGVLRVDLDALPPLPDRSGSPASSPPV